MYFGFENINISYGNKEIIKNLTCEIPKGKIVTIIGQNGCGKSTLLKTVSKSVNQKSGQVIYDEKNIKSYNPKLLARKIAYLSQIHSLPSDIDVRTLVSYGRYPYSKFGRGMTKEDVKYIDYALKVTGMESLQNKMLAKLSGGERQRARIAMTVAQEPEILILDEPTTYLDVGYQVEVLELVKHLNTTLNITILMVLHDLNLAARYSDFLYILKNGNIFAKGTPKEILTTENLSRVFSIKADVLFDETHKSPYFIPDKSEKSNLFTTN